MGTTGKHGETNAGDCINDKIILPANPTTSGKPMEICGTIINMHGTHLYTVQSYVKIHVF